jgi:hypothetical protein
VDFKVYINMGFLTWVEWETELRSSVLYTGGLIVHWPWDDRRTKLLQRRFFSFINQQREKA